MKRYVKRAIRDEQGNVLTLVLILLVVGGLILTPLLGLMSTGLVSGQVYERKMDEYYAADAGVEDAIWRIKYDPSDSYPYSYPDPEEPPWLVNEKILDVVIYQEDIDPTCEEELRYRILSTATSEDGSSTTIDAYLSVSYMDFSALLDNAIISQDSIDIQPGTEINGDIWLPDEEDLNAPPHWTHNGTVKDEDDVSMTWPDAGDLSGYYWDDVKHLEEEAYPDGYVMNIPEGTSEGDPYVIGPLLGEGDLTIKGNGWIRLEGTIYVKGNLNFNPTPSINIDLNKQTIFAEGEICLNPGVALYGSGCIIAIGYIDFQPSIASEGDEFILVMSITDVVWFHPNGDFTGCIAGDAHVELSPGGTINWISPEGKGLDFPMGVGDINELPPVTGISVLSWQIK